jgi:hypothetical protein
MHAICGHFSEEQLVNVSDFGCQKLPVVVDPSFLLLGFHLTLF